PTTATSPISTLSLHDALPIFDPNATVTVRPNGTNTVTSKISSLSIPGAIGAWTGKINITDNKLIVQYADAPSKAAGISTLVDQIDRKSTRLNSSHSQISYAVF